MKAGLLTLVILAGALAPSGGAAQEPAPPAGAAAAIPADSYATPAVQALLERGRRARGEIDEGLLSYEAFMWERTYVGVSGADFRRERAAFEQERAARIRWTREGEDLLLWERARRDLPIAGLSSSNDTARARSLSQDLARGGDNLPPPLLYDPGSDRISFGRGRVLSPLSDTAAFHYRFTGGDTLRIGLDASGEEIVLAEVRVEPRRVDPDLISGSLWFEVESGALVRSTYRPARPFDLLVDRPGGGTATSTFSGAFLAEIHYVTVDHGFHELRWWIPRRFAFEGSVRLGGIATLPFAIEWILEDVLVNEEGELFRIAAALDENLPPGWSVESVDREDDRATDSITIYLPPASDLAVGTALTGDSILTGIPRSSSSTEERFPGVFSPEEIERIEGAMDEIDRGRMLTGTLLQWRARDGQVYFNRVEGLSVGLSAIHPLGSHTDLEGEVRYGISDREVGGEVGVVHDLSSETSLSLSAFRRIDSSSEWAGRRGITSSLESLLFGRDETPFHRAWGAELSLVERAGPLRSEIRFFYERHASVFRATHAHLERLWSDDALLSENPAATDGRWGGASLDLRWEAGRDPRDPRIFGRVRGEVAGGTTRYLRGWTSAGAAIPLTSRLSGAVEFGIGASAGELPLQRRFFPGGPTVYRGAAAGELVGEAFWFARAELGRGLPAARFVVFADALEIAPQSTRAAFDGSDPHFAVGVGISFLDGLFRLDLAKQLTGSEGWKLFLYRDGLF